MGCGSSRTDNNKNIKKPKPTRNNNPINDEVEVYKNRTSPMPWYAAGELTSAFKAIKDGSQETGESKNEILNFIFIIYTPKHILRQIISI